eukprot:8462871-Pyramimonas_sp.AAC.1
MLAQVRTLASAYVSTSSHACLCLWQDKFARSPLSGPVGTLASVSTSLHTRLCQDQFARSPLSGPVCTLASVSTILRARTWLASVD